MHIGGLGGLGGSAGGISGAGGLARCGRVIGAAGGGTIPVQIARSIIGVVDFGLSAEQALALPLVMEVGSTIMIEQGSAPAAALSQLEALGHGNFAVRAAPVKANILLRTPGGWVSAREPRMAASLGTTP